MPTTLPTNNRTAVTNARDEIQALIDSGAPLRETSLPAAYNAAIEHDRQRRS